MGGWFLRQKVSWCQEFEKIALETNEGEWTTEKKNEMTDAIYTAKITGTTKEDKAKEYCEWL